MTVAEKSISTPVKDLNTDELKELILFHLRYSVGTTPETASDRDYYRALALSIRQQLLDGIESTEQRYQETDAKRVYYLSMEFLIGKSLENNLINLQLLDSCRTALGELGVDIEALYETEPDAGLGNGGLGRLAACFIDSMATLGIAGYGYGINYEYGLFRQEIRNGWQREKPDNWLTYGTPWQIERPEDAVVVPLYGRIDNVEGRDGEVHPVWVDWQAVLGVPHDMPVVGYEGNTVNILRLYSARGSHEFDMEVFNTGDYLNAVQDKIKGETISKVLYPSDAVAEGRELRLIQEYFMVACCIRDIFRRMDREEVAIDQLPEQAAIQLNDTHPALAVAEMMRVLVDEKGLPWDAAWDLTQRTLAYTNHTLLPEALEKWPVELVGRVLPRHLNIIFEINHRFLRSVEEQYPGDVQRLADLSLIEESENGEKQVRMCNLAITGSHSVNGVSALHSELVKTSLVPHFHELMPEKFNSKTNGITPRRWLLQANPRLAGLISDTIGNRWITHLDELRNLEHHLDDAAFVDAFRDAKLQNKQQLAAIIRSSTGIAVDPASMFDVQVKRIHQYKRQLLAVMQIIRQYLAITEDGHTPASPSTYIFSGKAAPGYWAAKQIIGLITHVAEVINRDPRANQWIKIVFLPNYRVSLAERIFPASDLSEQISTAGFEASGTGNMKFMLNGALTIGTLDGANVEMTEEVGEENIFIFGLRTEEIQQWHANGGPTAQDIYNQNPEIRRVFDALRGNLFSRSEPGLFGWAHDMLIANHDPYFHLHDMNSYAEARQAASELFAEPQAWTRKSILNVARAGKFSSDRTIGEYSTEIWNANPAN